MKSERYVALFGACLLGCSGAILSTAGTDDGGPDALVATPDSAVDAMAKSAISAPADTGTVTADATAPPMDAAACYSTTGSVSGTVRDPSGNTPVFNVTVYIPSGTQPGIAPGTAACNAGTTQTAGLVCDSTLGPIAGVAVTTTDANGAFKIDNVAAGKNVPLVIQLGKWRRQVVLPQVLPCSDNAVPEGLSRLPRNQSEGDIPQLAIVTGSCDRLACLLTKIGLDPAEFTSPAGKGRVHVYRGAGQAPDLPDGGAGDCSSASPACPLWSTKQALERYDGVLLGCECGEHDETKPDMTPMHDWLDEGGRVLAVHYASTWFRRGPSDFQSTATWSVPSDAGASAPFQIDTSGVRGNALRNWLAGMSALNSDQSLPIDPANVTASVAAAAPPTQSWITSGAGSSRAPALLSFATPVGGAASGSDAAGASPANCGRVAFSDVHAGGAGAPSSTPVPSSCASGAMTVEEKVLEFALFSLWSTCDGASSQQRP
jgi:hypothetical protein